LQPLFAKKARFFSKIQKFLLTRLLQSAIMFLTSASGLFCCACAPIPCGTGPIPPRGRYTGCPITQPNN